MPTQALTPGQTVHGFEVTRVEQIPELRAEASVFSHVKTHARLVHVFNDDPNNMFCIAFRTPVGDNTGVPHILEHSVLCGSRKFPVKDPFQELLKGSLQTFLNALTYPDKTVYPVSSQVERDFYNLVDIYCDAVFHPLLSDNTFYQEGWHFHAEKEGDPIDIKGIVYNEMKGVYSDFSSYAARKTMAALFPDTTYFYESGGDPEHIPRLTADGLRAFHGRYYHPSNSFIFLYGNLPSEKTLGLLDREYLHGYDRLDVRSPVEPQPLWHEPRHAEFEAPASREDDGTASVVAGWVWGPTTDPVLVLGGQVLFRYLLGTESSPLRRALIDSGLGEDLDNLTGFDADLVQSTFAAGLRKTRPELAAQVMSIINGTLEAQVDKGMDDDLLEGSLRQAEFRLREVAWSHRFPYSLMLAERCYRSWIYGGDPLMHLKFEGPLGLLKAEKARGHGFFLRMMRERLLDNPHRLVSVVKASSRLGAALERRTREHVDGLTRTFSAADVEGCRTLTRQLLDNQQRPNSPDALATLPRLRTADLPRENQKVPTEIRDGGPAPAHLHALFTAGIVYVDLGFDFSAVPDDLLPYLPLYSDLITRCGAGGFGYEEMSKRIALATGGISSSVTAHAAALDPDRMAAYCFLHGKVLPERFDEMLKILADLLLRPELGNTKLIKDILLEMRNDLKSAVVGSGHGFAMTHAASRLCRIGYVDELLGGITQLRFLEARVNEERPDALAERIAALHALLIRRNACVVSITADDPARYVAACESLVGSLPSRTLPPAQRPDRFPPDAAVHGIEIPSAVNFVARARRVENVDAAMTGTLFLLARHLSTGYLWDKVRVEGGAYGGSASFSSTEPVFHCASYRDPNLVRTLDIFDASARELSLTPEALEQSIIGAIGKVDAPRTPHDKGLSETVALLGGRTVEFRQRMREAILGATPERLSAVADRIFAGGETATTVIGSASAFDEAGRSGLRLVRSPLLEETPQRAGE